MFTKYLTLTLAILLINFQLMPVFAQTQSEKEAKNLAKLEAKIKKIGVGEDAGIKLTLKDETKLDGFVSSRDENGFDVKIKKTGEVKRVKYTDVKKVTDKKIPKAVMIAASVGLVFGVLTLMGLAAKSK